MLDKIIHFFLTLIVLGYIIFEEIVWERFALPINRFISRLKISEKLKHYLQRVDSKIILVFFLVIFGIVELQGILATSHFLQGKVVTGLLIYAGKIPISAFTYWLFNATRNKLMEFALFKAAYQFIMDWVDKITHSKIYKEIKAKTEPIKKYLKKRLMNNQSELKTKVTRIYRKLKVVVKRKLKELG